MPPRTVYVIAYHPIKDGHFIHDADELRLLSEHGLLPCSRENALQSFANAGWEGDATVEAIWIPPFIFEGADTTGVFLWHVQQNERGGSWLCAAEPFEFAGLETDNWLEFEVEEPPKEFAL